MRQPDDRPLYAVAALAVLLVVSLLVPGSRGWLAENVGASLAAQADPGSDGRAGYSVASLAFWAAVGVVLAWGAYELVFVRLGVVADPGFLLAIAPYLLVGPLLHALLAVGAVPAGSVLAYAAAEPLVYLTTAVLALVGLAVGRATGRSVAAPALLGVALLLPLLLLSAVHASGTGARRSFLLVALAVGCAVPLGWLLQRVRPQPDAAAATAVIGAHALDGVTTWMVLRDPFGLGFETFAEKNPVSRVLVEASNGWPYFAVKLALPIVLLLAVKAEPGEEQMHTFLLLAIFVLGYGPGMSNLLQVLFA